MVKLSVIIPTFNREDVLLRAVKGVLTQSFQDYEIIIVDDGSTDETKKILAPVLDRVRYVYQENKGISGARNRGIQAANGELIAFLDSDDEWQWKDKLLEQVKIFDTHRDVGLCYGQLRIIDSKGEPSDIKPRVACGKNFQEMITIGADFPTSTVVVRKECLEKVGLFDVSLRVLEDFDLWLRIARFYEVYGLTDQTFGLYHEGKKSEGREMVVYDSTARLYQKILDNYDDIPRNIVKTRLLTNRYLLAKSYYNKRDYAKALCLMSQIVFGHPLVGLIFTDDSDNFLTKTLKFTKPFVLLGVLLLKFIFSRFNRSQKSNLKVASL